MLKYRNSINSINLFRYTQKAYSSQNHNSKNIHINELNALLIWATHVTESELNIYITT